jgi:hypothetical protein
MASSETEIRISYISPRLIVIGIQLLEKVRALEGYNDLSARTALEDVSHSANLPAIVFTGKVFAPNARGDSRCS